MGSLFGQATPHAGNLISSSGVGVDIRDFYTLNNRVEGNYHRHQPGRFRSSRQRQRRADHGGALGECHRRDGGWDRQPHSKARRPASVFGIAGASTTANHVEGNYIGTNLAGSAPLGNGNGVQIVGRSIR